MKFAPIAAICVLAVVAGGCESATLKARRAGASVTALPPTPSDAWKGIASAADEGRINRLGLAWQDGIAQARPGHRREIESEGLLLKPLAALPRPEPTPGSYNCRLVKIGRSEPKGPLYEKFKPFYCYVLSDDQGALTIVKQTGSQRPAGQLFADDDPNRMVFLGSLALGDEKEPVAYGEDAKRDMAGVFERIAPFRWRLVIPFPPSGAKIEVFELTPVADQPE